MTEEIPITTCREEMGDNLARREKAVFERRVRVDQDELERLLFRLFEQQVQYLVSV